MSADSPKRSARTVPVVVPPQAVSDRSIIDSVTGFLNEVTLSNVPQIDPKDAILWARFETNADISDPTFGSDWDSDTGVAPPLLLILGYGNGIQVWTIPANGEAVEVLAWRHGTVRALRVLPKPDTYETAEQTDELETKRPLLAICDSNATGSSPQFCSVNFVSLRDGDQVKSIKFKNPILDILANRSVVVITFLERVAVFDAKTFEDRLTVTTCHPCPGLNNNPIALGSRWMAYAERKMLPSKRSSGGCDCDGVASYTATVLNAAKSLGKGLREFGGQMAAGFGGSGGNSSTIGGTIINQGSEEYQPGIVTIIDTKYSIKDTSPTTGAPISTNGTDPIIVHFVAHSDAIAAMQFNTSGMLLLTADRRGHDFHVFLILPHPCGPSLSAVHHLYVLHRGDTTAKVQDIEFSLDSRWVAVSTLRGTTHVFPITPYGGAITMRTHGSRQVVNRLSRFHRSAGLSADGRSNSPVHSDSSNQNTYAYNNPRGPPFPRPTVVTPLAQLRQPTTLGQSNLSSQPPKSGGSRQRLSSLSEESAKPLRVCATFAKARAWLLDPPGAARDIPSLRMQNKPVDSLFVMAGHGALVQYDLDVKPYSNVPKDKVCDDTSIELDVEPKAQWNLLRKENTVEIQPPLPVESWLFKERFDETYVDVDLSKEIEGDINWLSQVEIVTHAGPHRRLWMGPQFTFKTYNTPSGAPLVHIDSEAVEVGIGTSGNRPARSNPMNMPPTAGRSAVPVLIESGSCSSYEQSPRLADQYRHEHMGSDFSIGTGDSQLREDLADAMRESPSGYTRDSSGSTSTTKTPARNILVSVAKVVNPLGTVTTITESPTDLSMDHFGLARRGSGISSEQDDDFLIHENCDEALFRPVVAVFGTSSGTIDTNDDKVQEKPAAMGQDLIVPVIEKSDAENRIKSKNIKKDFEKMSKIVNDSENIEKVVHLEKMSKSKKDECKDLEFKMKEKNTVDSDNVQLLGNKSKQDKVIDWDEGKPSKIKSEKKVCQTQSSEKSDQISTKKESSVDGTQEKNKKKSQRKSQKQAADVKQQKTLPKDEDELEIIIVEQQKTKDASQEIEIKFVEEEHCAVKVLPKAKPRKKIVSQDIDELDVASLSINPKPISFADMMKANTMQSDQKETIESVKDTSNFDDENRDDEIIVEPHREEVDVSILAIEPQTKKVSKKKKKTIDNEIKVDENSEDRKSSLSDCYDFIQDDQADKIECKVSEDVQHILYEEILASSEDCSKIQESLFREPVAISKSKLNRMKDTTDQSQNVSNEYLDEMSNMPSPSTLRILEKLNLDKSKIISEAEFSDVSMLKKLEDESNPHEPMIINLNDLPPENSSEVTLIEFDTPPYEKPTMPMASTCCPKYQKTDILLSSLRMHQPSHSSGGSQQQAQHDSQDSDYKSLEFEIDETYLSLEPGNSSCSKYFETSSSDDTEDSSQSKQKIDGSGTKYKREDDEELQPLISSTASQEASLDSSSKGMTSANNTLPEGNQQVDGESKQQSQQQTNNGKKKSKKKRR